MKKSCLVLLAATVCACGSAIAEPTQNGTFNVPEIGAISIDGDLSDWSHSTPWSEPFILWNTLAGDEPMASATKAKFAWNDADDMLYVAIQTDQDDGLGHGGGHAVVGIGTTIDDIPHTGIGASQLAFDPGAGTSVTIMNEIQYYGEKYYEGNPDWPDAGIDGVVAAQTNSGGVWTYEIAVPFWENWTDMDTKQSISVDDVYYAYVVMENMLEGATGMNLTFEGNPGFGYAGGLEDAAALTFRATPIPGDANIDGIVDALDAAVLAANWLSGNAEWATGDFNGDHTVNEADVTILAANWQTDTAASVPEPSTLLLIGVGGLMLLLRKARQ